MIRTTDQLIDKISQDRVWRRKELTELRANIQEHNGALRSRVLIRSAVAILYSHWEGFVKISSSYYLEFVASQRLEHKNLAPNFLGLIIKSKFSKIDESKKISGGNDLADFFCTKMDSRSNVPYKKIIDTQSNLSSKVLLDILRLLGLDESKFSTRLNFIDKNLVNPRNHIAHGEYFDVTLEEYLKLHDDVISLIELFRNEIENASVGRQFVRVDT